MQWVCKACGDGHLDQEVFQLVDGAETDDEVRKIIKMHEVIVRVCDKCSSTNEFFQGV